MAFDLATVAQYVAGLNIPGMALYDYSTIPEEFDSREFPLLAPDLFQPITTQSVTRNSFGSSGTAKQTILYTVPYVLACYSYGEERGIKEIVPGVIAAYSDVLTALLENDTPGDLSVDLTIQSATVNVPVNDPSGHSYIGAKLVVLVKEFVEGVS
jgi:hypothetical protein